MSDRHGRTPPYQSKADWLLSQFAPDDVPFPLPAEIEVAIPKDLPGKVPRNEAELYEDELENKVGRPRRTRRARRRSSRAR